MLGFIKKDLFLLKSSAKFLIILLILFSFLAYSSMTDLSLLLGFTGITLMLTTFNYDVLSRWDIYAATLPNGRKNSVRAKYLLTLLILISATFLSLILPVIFSSAHNSTIDFQEILTVSLGNFFALSLVIALFYPFIYQFGIEKARIGIFVLVLSLALALGFATKYTDFSFIIDALNSFGNFLPLILATASIILLFVSYQISAKISENNEL